MEEFENQEKINEALKQERFRKLRNDLMDRGKREMESSQSSAARYKVLKIAASVAFFIFAGSLLFDSYTRKSHDILVNTASVESLMNAPSLSGNLANTDIAWKEALGHLQNGNHAESIEQFERLRAQAENSTSSKVYESSIYLGYCLIKIDEPKPKRSITYLESIPNNTNYYRTAQWYLGFAYLKNNQKEDALKCFEAVSVDNQNKYQLAAIEVLKNLK